MSQDLFAKTKLQEAFAALRRDLIDADGPRISTMRNYRFAILQYAPDAEYKLRLEAQRLSAELVANGWQVLSLDLQKLLLDRLRAQGDAWLTRVIAREKQLSTSAPARALNDLQSKLTPLIEGPDGLAADCSRLIQQQLRERGGDPDRSLVLIGRAGAIYPFYRTSALLKHLDGRTGNLPVVLLYPGARRGQTGLSFMGILDADDDYRPRIYP